MKKEALIITLIAIATIAVLLPIIFDFSFKITGKAILENKGCTYEFIRGDANHDETVNYFDSQFLLNYLFSGGVTPDCFDASDANDDNAIDIGDVASLNDYSANGLPLPAPFPNPGTDEPCDYVDNDGDLLKDEGCVRKCVDSDGGKNYNLNGSVKETYGTLKSQVSDMCNRNTNELWEWYCDSLNNSAYVIYQCPNLCKEGACVSAPVQPQQNTTQNNTNQSSNQTANQSQNNTNQSSNQTANTTSSNQIQNQTQTNMTLNQSSNQTRYNQSQNQSKNNTNQSQNNTNQSSNQTEITISIISPTKNSNIKAGVIQYIFKVESQDEIASCILSLNELPAEELILVSLTQPNTFNHDTPKGTHSFYVSCIDIDKYYTSSDETTFTVYEEETGSTDYTDSSGSEESGKISISEQDLEQGVTFDLAFDETIELRFNNSDYSFGLIEVQEDYALFLLSDSKEEIRIDINKENEIDLNGDGETDIIVTIDDITPDSISLQIKKSQASDPARHSKEKTKSNAAIYLTAVIISTIMIVVIIVTLMLLSQSRKRSNLEKSLKDYA